MNFFKKRVVSLILVTTFIVSSVACTTPKEAQEAPQPTKAAVEGENVKEEENVIATQLVQAKYPEMVQYPVTEEGAYEYEEFEAWRTSVMAQQPESKEYQNGIREYYEVTMNEFLKDSDGKNKIYSPLNVYMALAMLAETTEGESRQQILDLLHTDSIETLRDNAYILWNANYCDDGTVTSRLASSIWLKDGLKYNPETLNTLANNYYTSSFSGTMGSAEYNSMLQGWLNEQTGGLLEEQAGNVQMDPMTVFALASTVYFQAKWNQEFYKPNNTQEIFHTANGDVTTEFMHQSKTDTYYWGEKFGAISRRLKYSGDMLFILPDEGVAVEELLTDAEVLDFIYDNSEWENKKVLIVNQSVPKFDVASDYSLVEGLKNLGVTDVFSAEEADFTPLLANQAGENEVSVSEAKHAARVMIDEEGCTAAAFTVMLAAGAARPPEEKMDFILDRPFMFVINGQDGQPLFIGIVNQPN